MIHGSGSGLLDLGLRRYAFLGGMADPLIFRGRQIRLNFGAKMVLCCGGQIRVLGTQLLDPVI
jgi:hypothetical protein